MIHFTELDRLPTYDVKGNFIGLMSDLLVDPERQSLRVESYLIRSPAGRVLEVAHEQMRSISMRSAQTSALSAEIQDAPMQPALLHVRKDVLDQQIIDTNRRKVVRVNDVEFDIEPREQHSHLRIIAVNVGLAAAVRRLLQGLIAKHRIRAVADIFPDRAIPWEFVNLIESDPARRVQLRISYDRLSGLHPADLADILSELSRDEQQAVIEGLDPETAADALAEIPDKNRTALLERITPRKAAGLVDEMEPDEAADTLQNLSPTASAEVLATMEQEGADDVRALLQFDHDTAGGLMTKSFVGVTEAGTVADALRALRQFDGEPQSMTCVYLTDAAGVLAGAVSLRKIVLAESPITPLRMLSDVPVIAAGAHDDTQIVIALFRKYDLVVLAVTDDDHRLLGVITVDDVLTLLAPNA
jgi:CBS domain-containing protein/sporulation protein YlmC with PRC-barrel domain